MPDPFANSMEFAVNHSIRMDGNALDFGRYSHLVLPYTDAHPQQIDMCGAQVGKTTRQFVTMTRAMCAHPGAFFGAYYPNQAMADLFSGRRFKPFVKSSPALAPYLGAGSDGMKGNDAVRVRTFGPSTILFMTTEGVTSTEGMPLKGVFLDEVRRMDDRSIQLVIFRTDAQEDPYIHMSSTAGWPDTDIHARFQAGDQRYFHTTCKCDEGCVLSLSFPDCVVDLTSASPEYVRHVKHAFTMAGIPYCGVDDVALQKYGAGCFICPKCGELIVNPRQGYWMPHNPGAYVHSWQFSQMISPQSSGPKIAQSVYRPTGITSQAELYQSIAGVPRMNGDEVPVNETMLRACVNPDLRWPATKGRDWIRANIKNCSMGIDHMGGYLCIVIKQRQANGKHRDIHVEVTSKEDVNDPFQRAGVLMLEYDVGCCVLEGLPNYNDAHRFALAFPGKVFILNYANSRHAKPVVWADRNRITQSLKGEGIDNQFTLAVNKTAMVAISLGRWKGRQNETPAPEGLIQDLPWANGKVQFTAGLKRGFQTPRPIVLDAYWHHLTHTGFMKVEDDEESGRYHQEVKGVGVPDPHFTMAAMMADVACARGG